MNEQPRILIASASPADAELVERLLRAEFDDIALSCDPKCAASDFEAVQPQVLVLAFNSLERAESYYLGLYRLSPRVHAIAHRTVILCNKDDLRKVYELCRRDYFDDYVLFWPVGNDVTRLLLATHRAGRPREEALSTQLAQQAARLGELETVLRAQLGAGSACVQQADDRLQQVGHEVDQAVELWVENLPSQPLDRHDIRAAVEQLRRQSLEPPLKAACSATAPLRSWIDEFPQRLAPQLESARTLGALARQLPPLLLMIDDDAFQQRLVHRLLNGSGIELAFADDGAAALAQLDRRTPSLILMDLNLPDFSGVELTRKIKAMPQLAEVPVMMITGDCSKAVVLDSRQAGAVDFVAKPFEREVLLGKLRRYLGALPEQANAPTPAAARTPDPQPEA